MVETKRLGDIATYINGYAFKPDDWCEEGLPIIRIQDLTGTSYQQNYYKGDYPAKIEINDGDVLISWSASLGVHIWNRGKALLNQHIFKVVFDKVEVDKQYFVYAVQYNLENMLSKMHGATMKHIVKKDFDNIEVPFPTLAEQKRVASILTYAKDAIEDRKQQLTKLDNLVKSRFVEMFGDPVINPYNLPVVTLGEISNLITKGASPSWQGFSYTQDSTQTLFITSENVREGYIDLSSKKYIEDAFNERQKRSVIHKGDFLINIVGASIGRAAQFNLDCKANMNQAAALVRVNDERIRDKYLTMYLNSDKAQRMYNSMKSDTGRANLSLQDISNLSILLPSIEDQLDFEDFVKQIDKSKVAIQAALDKTQLLFDSLMQEYFG
ncbi:restriction endonuclease subunit S [Allobaculum stercoricanis]|uniref:restriction endonuclease subunit S n=1 Tax=Allobaculum stercoricanis TaxID=174709 RepID=UPI0023EF5765|nr:restriction endonuclease subunit S [Allobaculum stercoricanis]